MRLSGYRCGTSVSVLQEFVLTLETKAETMKPARWIDLSDARRKWNRIILPRGVFRNMTPVVFGYAPVLGPAGASFFGNERT